jgi:hypothetical protein
MRRHLSVLALVSLVSCDSPLGPSDVAGTYVFAPAGGIYYPYIAGGGEMQTFRLAIHDTVVLRRDGTGRISGDAEWIVAPPDAPPVGPRSANFNFVVGDGVVDTDVHCPIIDCGLGGFDSRFRLVNGSLVRDNGGSGFTGEVYRRVGPPLD